MPGSAPPASSAADAEAALEVERTRATAAERARAAEAERTRAAEERRRQQAATRAAALQRAQAAEQEAAAAAQERDAAAFIIAVLADDILKNVEYDAQRVVFNKFHSVISFKPTMTAILSPEAVEKESEAGGKIGDLDSYEIEGGETKSEVLQNLTEFQFSCVLYNAALENACSELGARMSAMDSSSQNAGEMLDRLNLTYNMFPSTTSSVCMHVCRSTCSPEMDTSA